MTTVLIPITSKGFVLCFVFAVGGVFVSFFPVVGSFCCSLISCLVGVFVYIFSKCVFQVV